MEFNITEFDKLTGVDFEKALYRLLETQRFEDIEYTPKTADFGVDILAIRDGTKYGIQVKRSINTVGISAVQETIGGVLYYECGKGIIITNSIYSQSAQELAKKAGILLVQRDDLKKWISKLKLEREIIKLEPRPYQTEALTNLKNIRELGGNKALIVMASGLGKTYLAAFDVQNFECELDQPVKVLYLAHQGVILEQASRAFRAVFGSKRSYGRFDGDLKEPDKEFVFATFQSIFNHLDHFSSLQFSYIIVDEAHHTSAKTRDKVVNHFKPLFLTGLTATPNRFDGKDIYSYYNDTIGINLPLERALSENLLTPVDYKVFSDKSSPVKLASVIREMDGPKKADKIFKPRSGKEIVQIVKRISKDNFESERTIVFCNSLDQMDYFAGLFDECVTISGRDSRSTQIKKIDKFADGKYPMLLARDVLNEGIDVPSVNMLVFLRNSESPVVFLQQLGRGLRKTEDKKKVVVLDFVCNIERIRYVYSFYSRLDLYRRVPKNSDTTETDSPFVTKIEFDETSRNVIKALLEKKVESGVVVPLSNLLVSFNYGISNGTLDKLVRNKYLIPDYELKGDDEKMLYFLDSITLKRFMRQVISSRSLEGFISENNFAKSIGKPVSWLRRKQKWGRFCPSWVHLDTRGVSVFGYKPEDLEEVKQFLT